MGKMPEAQNFLIPPRIMYDRTGSVERVDEARLHLCTQKDGQIEAVHLQKPFLLQHVTRGIYQGSLV